MTREEAITFLVQNQPLPSDSELDEDTIRRFDEVRQFFEENPDPDCVRLLLNALGEGSGFGVYQLLGNTLLRQDRRCVIRELGNALQSPRRSVRNWSAEIAALFPSDLLIEPIISLLAEDDFDMKYAALTALEQSEGSRKNEALVKYAETESDPELRGVAREILGLDES